MAPISPKRGRDDDFVFTLSDAEGEPSEFETEVPLKKKQKLNTAKPKSSKIQPATQQAEEEASWLDGGENDGALNSDFEFQVGETTDIIEDFDGWEVDSNRVEAKNVGGGVDVDFIIRRRRDQVAKAATGLAGTNGEYQENAADESSQKDPGKDRTIRQTPNRYDGSMDEEDETLAPDGFGMGVVENEADVDGSDNDGLQNEERDASIASGESDIESAASPVPHPDDHALEISADEDDDDPEEARRKAAFFASEDSAEGLQPVAVETGGSFQSMQLSRPILKGLASVGFSEPTPIQSKTIPVALLGKDVVGGAVTGSGKTAAFMIPILERLLYRPKKVPTTRVAILMPTRELAVQCFNVAKKLGSFTDITFAQIVGGYSIREQENVLKSRPDIVIATPGRFIDHMRNSPSFAVDTLEILVLDEADRMLEDGFADELNEILTTIPKSRQTMLFSATMTDSVDKLIRVGLNRPVRLMIDAKRQTVSGLVQEFVRLRPGKEDRRLAFLMHLCERIHTHRVIIFFRQKKEAHRIRVIFSLCGLKATELHGSMTQEQRITAVEAFRSGSVSFLLATDLASRGLDIKNVSTVLNYEAPQTHEIYLHRVGRTARAGRSGCACTIAADADRKMVKAAVKSARMQGAKIVSRTVDTAEVDAWHSKLQSLENEVEEVLREEKEERAMQVTERDLKKGENIIQHEAEIMARPKRTWFESERQKKAAKQAGFRELNPDAKNGKKEKRKLSNKDKKKLQLRDDRSEGRVWKKGRDERGIRDITKAAKKGKGGAKPTGKVGKFRQRK